MRSPMLVAMIALASTLAGCSAFGGGDDGTERESVEGPHVFLLVENKLAHEIAVRHEGAEEPLMVGAGESKERAVPLRSEGAHTLRFSYSWTSDGRAGSGDNSQLVDTRACPGTLVVVLAVGQDANGTTFSSTSSRCET